MPLEQQKNWRRRIDPNEGFMHGFFQGQDFADRLLREDGRALKGLPSASTSADVVHVTDGSPDARLSPRKSISMAEKIPGMPELRRQQIRNDRESILNGIDRFLSENPGKPVPINGRDFDLLRTADILKIEDIQKIFGPMDKMERPDLHTRLKFEGDSVFSLYTGEKFHIKNHPIEGVHNAEDINYYFQGLLMAAARKKAFTMDAYIVGHNLKQAWNRRGVYDLQQIPPALNFANDGYSFYKKSYEGMHEQDGQAAARRPASSSGGGLRGR
ncbi:hypothetical protein [Solimonas sp. SE-A11]|uniref:hypothetical protein n=1 Tax=Solimonas sp. SE-A11 TaxID=3054954 RepID=UPI00259CE4F6|nr:hypothetical protein [Solimonas sp. SE-A11]MDM4773062.1 hypothetical protein [Solimonas sp. SE-A11]